MCSRNYLLCAMVVVAGCSGSTGPAGLDAEQGPEGPPGSTGEPGDTGEAGPEGPTGADGPQGEPGAGGDPGNPGGEGPAGVACWDQNGSGVGDPGEDENGDGVFDVHDCIGAPAASSNETCELCHGPGRIADLAIMHGIEPSPVQLAEPAELLVTIDDVTVSVGGEVDVAFTIVDGDGDAWVDLGGSDVRMTLAQLQPAVGGDPSRWQSYLVKTETPAPGVGTGDGGDELQATYQHASGGTLAHLGAGAYGFRFGSDDGSSDMDIRDVVASGVSPVAVPYDADFTHRVAMQFSNSLPVRGNPTLDFVPSGAALSTRAIVDTATCNSCHNELALHGGGRKDVEYCVTCHNPGSVDANSDQSVDLTVMTHRIHAGRHLPSVEAGGEYAIWGYRDSKHDYSEVGFPQTLSNCEKCHDTDNGQTPDADNYATMPNQAACGSCHDDVDFPSGAGHNGIAQADNSACAGCHDADAIRAVHTPPEQVLAANFEYNVEDVSHSIVTGMVDVRFSVTNPADGDSAYDILQDPEFTADASRLAVLVGWDTRDYHNTGSGRAAAQPLSIDPLSAGSTPATDNLDGTFTVTATLPPGAMGSGAVAIEGHPAGDPGDGVYDVRVPVRSAFEFFAITDVGPVPRRAPIDVVDRCGNCHGSLSMHGANRTDEGQVCVMCHNPNATDIARRPDDHTSIDTLTADGKKEETIDFKVLIHAIHGAAKRPEPFVVWGYGSTEHVFGPEEVTFPGILSRCDACHSDDSYTLPLAPGVLGTTIDTAPDAAMRADASDEALNDPDDDLNVSPTAAVCSACHSAQVAKAHMEHNGASFEVRQSQIE